MLQKVHKKSPLLGRARPMYMSDDTVAFEEQSPPVNSSNTAHLSENDPRKQTLPRLPNDSPAPRRTMVDPSEQARRDSLITSAPVCAVKF